MNTQEKICESVDDSGRHWWGMMPGEAMAVFVAFGDDFSVSLVH
jgi:hypothetical protein